ncbi:MAG: hypothetical protein PUJ21_04805 [Clostridia bacterium]|nr:hypothetical protein [Clostridia bacterium]MDY6183872.1 hypothetical protein [Eubacteriales bacterium]
MPINLISEREMALSGVSSLPLTPTASPALGGRNYTPAEMKAAFDRLPRLIAERLNELLSMLRDGGILGEIPVSYEGKSMSLADFCETLKEHLSAPPVYDDTPVENGTVPVTSGGVYAALADAVAALRAYADTAVGAQRLVYDSESGELKLYSSENAELPTASAALPFPTVEKTLALIRTLLGASVLLETTEDTFCYRTSGGGLPIVDGAPVSFLRVTGDTVASGTGPKHTSFLGVKSTGSNLADICGAVGEGITESGVTITQESDGYLHFSGIPAGSYRGFFVLSQDLFQDGETYTFAQSDYFGKYGVAYTAKNAVYWKVTRKNLATGETNHSLISTDALPGSVTFDKKTYSYGIAIVNGSYAYTSGDEMDVSLRLWVNHGASVLPFAPYHAASTVLLPAAVSLGKWDTLDLASETVTRKTAMVSLCYQEGYTKNGQNASRQYYLLDDLTLTKELFSCLISNLSKTDDYENIASDEVAYLGWDESTGHPVVLPPASCGEDTSAWTEVLADAWAAYPNATATSETVSCPENTYLAWEGGTEEILRGEAADTGAPSSVTAVAAYYVKVGGDGE